MSIHDERDDIIEEQDVDQEEDVYEEVDDLACEDEDIESEA